MPNPLVLVTVPPSEQNLSHVLGTDKVFKFTAYNLDGVSPTNITGWSISFILHQYGDPTNVYLTLTVGAGVVISNGSQGETTVTVSATNIASFVPNLYQWRLERTDSGNDFVIGKGNYSLLAR